MPWASGNGVPEWQWAATRFDLVPSWVQRGAARITIAIVDTGGDVSAPDIAAKQPITHSVVTGRPDVVDTVGHGTFVASLAAGSITNGDGIAGFRRRRTADDRPGEPQRQLVHGRRRGGDRLGRRQRCEHLNLSLGGPRTSRVERDAIAYAAARGVLVVAAAVGWGVLDVAAAVARAGGANAPAALRSRP
jgi:thermitase